MAKKKKTMVMMPGAMTDLAHSVQKSARPNPTTNSEETTTDEQEANEPAQYDTNNVEQEVRTQVEEQQPEEYAEAIGDVDEPVVAPNDPCKSVWSCRAKTRRGLIVRTVLHQQQRSSQRRRADS